MTPQIANPSPFLNWPDALIDPQVFGEEQARLARVWTLLGFAHDVAKDGDWLRATIATRSVFVQRFGNELRGFENRCAHRSFPLRNADKGNGPIVCGFHHWRYDKDGHAVGVPQCIQLFGGSPSELSARLTRIEIDTCGSLIFGRFTAPGDNQTLRQFLGEGFDILGAISKTPVTPQRITRSIEANWRICFHANVEDYHPVTVHASTFGKEGYPSREKMGYHRFGWHSAYFSINAPDALTRMAAECRDGVWRSANYRVFHFFPDLDSVAFPYGQAALLHRRHTICASDPGPFKHAGMVLSRAVSGQPSLVRRLTRGLVRRASRFTMPYFVGMVLKEDDVYSKGLQSVARQLSPAPMLGALEERLAWFEEAYAELMHAQ